jgi:NTE family protein
VQKRIDLVLEGGGVKGIGLVGALAVLEREDYVVNKIAGTSAGSIVAALYAAGYSAAELRSMALSIDFARFKDAGWARRVPMIGAPLGILQRQGFHRGRVFHRWIADLLAAKGVRTFKDLPELQVIVSDLTLREMLVLPRDAHHLGLDPDRLDVALAVRASISVPFVFEPLRVREGGDGLEHVLVDGGMLSNFPVWLFDVKGEPERATFGLVLAEPDPRKPIGEAVPAQAPPRAGFRAVVAHGRSLLETMMEAHDRRSLAAADYCRTIKIPTLGIGTVDFGIPRQRIDELYQSGAQAAEQFLKTWDFEDYKASFRAPTPEAAPAPAGP